ncbi:MAG: hypothetical protein RJQ21_10370 [Rhodospirillales bacterium]
MTRRPQTPTLMLLPLLLGAMVFGMLTREPVGPTEPAEPVLPLDAESEVAELRQVDLPPPPPLPAAEPVSMPAVEEPSVEHTVRILKPVAQPPSRPVRSAPDATPGKELVEAAVNAASGRVALLLLEHGKGPEIEIAWPEDRLSRTRLYDFLIRCIGMETALMNAEGLMFDTQSARSGTPPDLDRTSGFVRQAHGALPAGEVETIRRLRRQFAGHPGLTPVRLFPRSQDAILLGGLTQLAGDGYEAAARIEARYHLDGQNLLVTDLRVDGASRPGSIRLSGNGACHQFAR